MRSQGFMIYTPRHPHSPRSADAYLVVDHRQRRAGEVDRLRGRRCHVRRTRKPAQVRDHRADPVSKAYVRFFDSEDFCTWSGKHVMPKPYAGQDLLRLCGRGTSNPRLLPEGEEGWNVTGER